MAGRTPRPEAPFTATLAPLRQTCEQCGNRVWVASHGQRKVVTLEGVFQFRVVICSRHLSTCARFHVRSHPKEEGRWALLHGACGLAISQRAVTHAMQRAEELVSVHVPDQERLKTRRPKHGHVILALDGLYPDVGHGVLQVTRGCPSEEILLACPLPSRMQGV